MALTQVLLTLARNPGFPDGDPGQGYVITAPLDAEGRLDPEEWRQERKACAVLRFRPGEERHADGFLAHRGANWFVHYDEEGEGEDEPLYRLGTHRLSVGEYVTIHEDDGQFLTYRVQQHIPVKQGRHSLDHSSAGKAVGQ